MTGTDLLKSVSHLLKLLFETSKLQARALLETLDMKQIKAVREIIYNILHGDLPLSESQQETVKKRSKILERIVRKKGYKAGDAIARHNRIVYQTLCLVRDHILPML